MCFAIPTESAAAPIVLDFGTSVAAEGKVRVHQINQTPVPDGWLLDHKGQPTNDPSVLYQTPAGSILPLGGNQSYKGFGLALVLDILAGGLSGGQCSRPGAPPARGNNVFCLVLDPDSFLGCNRLKRQATELAEYVRATPRAPGVDVLFLPGDIERFRHDDRMSHGVTLEQNHWLMLSSLAARLGVTVPITTLA